MAANPSLADMLEARDRRRERQAYLLASYPALTPVCITVVTPGAEKRNELVDAIFAEALKCVVEAAPAKVVMRQSYFYPTGPEAFLLINLSEHDAKRLTTRIEETHPLGRLFDIDVIGRDGVPVSRTVVGAPPRRCLLCDNDARVCMRMGAHSYQQLNSRIKQMADEYFV